MSNAIPSAIQPQLSPAFGRARRLSRLLALLFTIGLFFSLILSIVLPVMVVWPGAGAIKIDEQDLVLTGLSLPRRLLAAVGGEIGLGPSLVILYHARLLFRRFAEGEVFSAAAIAHIRTVGLWLMLYFITNMIQQALVHLAMPAEKFPGNLDPKPLMLIFGIATFIAAYVMAEARRIADENASIL